MVYLVGAGPGDPSLLTIRAAQLIGAAEALVYDDLVEREVLDLAPKACERIRVGKRAGHHTMPQPQINALLVRLAAAGRAVVRLKGGDPFVFGRGAEEAQALRAAGIAFEVVPGVTAACGMAAYAGIPLTHREHAQACVFVTGHLKQGSLDLDWQALAQPGQTLVFYMGLAAIGIICDRLTGHGLPASTPAAVVQGATTALQRQVSGTLATLPTLARAAGIGSPALIVVGAVVGLQKQLRWFDPAISMLSVADAPSPRLVEPCPC
jgi:uroporphyrin-III C-methyltransferase